MTGSADIPWLNRDAVRRIVISLIAAAQAPRLRSGAIGPAHSILVIMRTLPWPERDKIAIDEATLGCDSLALLDTILQVNRFFGLHTSGVEDYLLAHPDLATWCDLIDQHRDIMKGDVRLTFATSGSTGTPKQLSFALSTLVAEMRAHLSGPCADQPPSGRIIALVPPQHIYGCLFTCILPSLTGAAVLDLHQGVPTRAISLAQPGDLIIATPHIWNILAQSGQRFAPDVRGMTSAGPSDATTWAIRETAGLTKMTEVFGSTETAGLGTRTAPDAPFVLLSHLTRNKDLICRDGHPLPLQDNLLWCGRDRFTVAGRRDDVIQVGGTNVSPAHVARTLQTIPGVAEAAVRLGDTGLRAFVVPAVDAPTDLAFQAHVRREITARLDPPARPAALSFGSALPRNSLGKLMDWDDPTQSAPAV